MDIHDPHPDCGVPDDYDDVGEAIREDRALRTARAYRMLYANNGLDFGPLLLNDPVPLGRQILETAGVRALAAWSLLAILPRPTVSSSSRCATTRSSGVARRSPDTSSTHWPKRASTKQCSSTCPEAQTG
jgi:hypothetical protein